MLDQARAPHKLSHLVRDRWVEHSWKPTFAREQTTGGGTRLVIGVPSGEAVVFEELVARLSPPCFVLYVLHTPRGEGEPGRYQSPRLDGDELEQLLGRFSTLFSGDARHDLWVHSPETDATLVWDRHNLIYAYGPLDRFEQTVRSLGFDPGPVPHPSFAHLHHYREEFDGLAAELLAALDWRRSALQPGDEQLEV
jgi:hypothetical protein